MVELDPEIVKEQEEMKQLQKEVAEQKAKVQVAMRNQRATSVSSTKVLPALPEECLT